MPARFRGSGTSIEMDVDEAGAVYPLSIDPIFTQQQKLTPSDAVQADHFGVSVGLSSDGNTALVGAWNRGLALRVHALRRRLDPATETDRVRWSDW